MSRFDLLTPKLYLAAVKQKGKALAHVPQASRTKALCIAAITQDHEAIEYSPWSPLELMSIA